MASQTETPIRERILTQALATFMQRGVRSVTLDELAHDLGISKKTIYQHFENKAEIVMKTCELFHTHEQAQIEAIHQSAHHAIEEVVGIMRWVNQALSQISPVLIYELQRHYPEAWDLHQHHEQCNVYGSIRRNLEWGMAEGLYRAELDADLVARIRVAQIDTAFDQRHFPYQQYGHGHVQQGMMDLFLHGITTAKGLKVYKKLKEQSSPTPD